MKLLYAALAVHLSTNALAAPTNPDCTQEKVEAAAIEWALTDDLFGGKISNVYSSGYYYHHATVYPDYLLKFDDAKAKPWILMFSVNEADCSLYDAGVHGLGNVKFPEGIERKQ